MAGGFNSFDCCRSDALSIISPPSSTSGLLGSFSFSRAQTRRDSSVSFNLEVNSFLDASNGLENSRSGARRRREFLMPAVQLRISFEMWAEVKNSFEEPRRVADLQFRGTKFDVFRGGARCVTVLLRLLALRTHAHVHTLA